MQVLKKARALMAFTVSYGGIRLRVRVLPTAIDVWRESTGKQKWRSNLELPLGLFLGEPNKPYTGTIVLASSSDLLDTIPHEVFHAILYARTQVHTDDDEGFAYALGILSSRIYRKIARRLEIGV